MSVPSLNAFFFANIFLYCFNLLKSYVIIIVIACSHLPFLLSWNGRLTSLASHSSSTMLLLGTFYRSDVSAFVQKAVVAHIPKFDPPLRSDVAFAGIMSFLECETFTFPHWHHFAVATVTGLHTRYAVALFVEKYSPGLPETQLHSELREIKHKISLKCPCDVPKNAKNKFYHTKQPCKIKILGHI